MAIGAFVAVIGAVGCGPSAEDASASDEQAVSVNTTVSGTVSYTGTRMGALYVGLLFLDGPPRPPVAVAAPIEHPKFPQAFKIGDVPPGRYSVVSFMDLAPLNPARPGDEDPQSSGTAFNAADVVVVVAGTPAEQSTVLNEPKSPR